MAKGFALAALALYGIMLASVLTHPKGAGTLFGGLEGLTKTTSDALLGKAP